MTKRKDPEKIVREIKRKARRKFSPEEKIRIVLEGLRGEETIVELCRREGISLNLYYTWLPLPCPRCGQPMRAISFILEPPVIERILRHVGEPTEPPVVLPVRSPPQGELAFDQDGGPDDWPEMDQSVGTTGDPWD